MLSLHCALPVEGRAAHHRRHSGQRGRRRAARRSGAIRLPAGLQGLDPPSHQALTDSVGPTATGGATMDTPQPGTSGPPAFSSEEILVAVGRELPLPTEHLSRIRTSTGFLALAVLIQIVVFMLLAGSRRRTRPRPLVRLAPPRATPLQP